MNRTPGPSKEDRRRGLYLMIRLSHASGGRFPRQAYLEGPITDIDWENGVPGGFSDVYRARYGGGKVAVKRLRVSSGQDREKAEKVCIGCVMVRVVRLLTDCLPPRRSK
jgi:hypothetical protein